MAYAPKQNVIDARALSSNLLAFITTTQADALTWANKGTPLKVFQQITVSVANRNQPVFPSLAVADQSVAVDFEADVLQGGYRVRYEVMISSPSSEILPELAKKYAYALESMIANINTSVFLGSQTTISNSRLSSIETKYSELQTNEQHNAYLQVFQTQADFILWADPYN